MDCSCQIGQRCSFGKGCTAQGTRDGVEPDAAIPGSAWCLTHSELGESERTAIWQRAVWEQEMRERNAAP